MDIAEIANHINPRRAQLAVASVLAVLGFLDASTTMPAARSPQRSAWRRTMIGLRPRSA